MSTRDLFELASLDALGLLDEGERESFEQAFRAAPPHVQAQVRRQQLHFTQIDDLLPEVAPPPGLKARVMAAVRQAITAVANEGPVARVGRVSSFSAFMNFAPMWRAACIGFATASLVLGWFLMGFAAQAKKIDEVASGDAIMRQLANDAAGYIDILSRDDHQSIRFAPLAMDIDAANPPSAVLYIEPETNRALLMCSHLPHGGGHYSLVLRGDGLVDQVRQVQFEANGANLQAVGIKRLDTDSFARLALVYDEDGALVLAANEL